MSVSVWLSASISPEPHVQHSPNYLFMLPVVELSPSLAALRYDTIRYIYSFISPSCMVALSKRINTAKRN